MLELAFAFGGLSLGNTFTPMRLDLDWLRDVWRSRRNLASVFLRLRSGGVQQIREKQTMSRNFGIRRPAMGQKPPVWPLLVVGLTAICVISATAWLPHP